MDSRLSPPRLTIIGGGPAGLMAAEAACNKGLDVHLFDGKGSVGRKFLIAGKGGLNLTHAEPRPAFDARYRERAADVGRWLDRFDADALRHWAQQLGVETYIGSSGRVFPNDRKAAPLLRAWLRRLKEQGLQVHVKHQWQGWNDDGTLRFSTPEGERTWQTDALVLALGGASWPQLGSDAQWLPLLEARSIAITALQPANCGFDVDWSAYLSKKFAGAPLKPVIAHWQDQQGLPQQLQGECVLTETGIEGSLIYAIAADLRHTIAHHGHATLQLDLAPGRDDARLLRDLQKPRQNRSLSEHLRRHVGISGAKAALLFEVLAPSARHDMTQLASCIKRLPLKLLRPRPMAETISTAGGIDLQALNTQLMLNALPGVFCAGEMLDWEAPTGGYLLTACFASGLCAGEGAVQWLDQHPL
jgi:uncharacterized flavoprotein (TIGR03862 family)